MAKGTASQVKDDVSLTRKCHHNVSGLLACLTNEFPDSRTDPLSVW